MTINTKVLVIEKIQKDYNFEGRTGTTLAVRCLIGTDVFRFKTSKEVLEQLEDGKTYTVALDISTVKEEPRFVVLSVVK